MSHIFGATLKHTGVLPAIIPFNLHFPFLALMIPIIQLYNCTIIQLYNYYTYTIIQLYNV